MADKIKQTKRVHNLIIVDESGSMMAIYQPALTGVNETLQTIREAQNEHEELRPNVAEGDVVLVTVITDGYENASHEYNGKAIRSLVEAMKNEGWVFTYIGANQDVEAVAESMSIDNHLAFNADFASTTAMFEKECNARKKIFSKVSRNMVMSNLSHNYFDDWEEEKNNSEP